MKKKLISIALLAVVAALLLSATAFADGVFNDKDVAKLVPGGIYEYTENGAKYQQKISTTFDFVEDNIAYKIVGDNQVEVSDWSWRWVPDTHGKTGFISSEYSNHTKLEIPATVTHESTTYDVVGIGKGAFVYVTGTQVVLPESITYFGSEAFCEFKDTGSLVIPASVTRIDYNCFEKCSLKSITFAEGSQLKSIGKEAFKGCTGLSEVVLPEGVEELGESLFSGLSCPVTIPGSVTNFSAPVLGSYTGDPEEDITFTEGPANFIVQDGVIYAYGALIKVYDSTRTEITVPDGIEVIGASAFGPCVDLETVHLPDSIRTIGDKAFMNLSKLATITGLENVTSVGSMTFRSCTSLTSVDLANVTEIPDASFLYCTSLTSVSAPKAVSIGKQAFNGCSSLISVYMPSVEEIGDSAFAGCGLTEVVGLDKLKTVDMLAFKDCPLTKVVLPETLESIGVGAFANMSSGGSKLSVLVMQGKTPPQMAENAFLNAPETLTVIIPEGSEDAYKETTALGGFIGSEDEPAITFSLSLDPASLNLLDVESGTINVAATVPEGYMLQAASTDNTVATAALSDDGKIITVKALKNGTATVSVSIVSEDKSITLVTKSCSVVVGASYTVTIVYGNGSADGIVYIPQGESYKLPPAPTKPGYIFMGWRGADGATYQPGDEVAITGDTSFKAIWANMPDITPGTPDEPDEDVFPFYDVAAGAWYYDAVKYVWENGIMNGTGATEFSPNTTLNRAMIWTMLARIDGVSTDGGANWYAKAQEWAMAEGVSDGTDPMGAVTREQLVTMLWRFKGEPTVDFLLTAKDADTVSSWAYEAMRWAVAEGIIEGDENGLITPTATATRAQAAAIFMRFIEG